MFWANDFANSKPFVFTRGLSTCAIDTSLHLSGWHSAFLSWLMGSVLNFESSRQTHTNFPTIIFTPNTTEPMQDKVKIVWSAVTRTSVSVYNRFNNNEPLLIFAISNTIFSSSLYSTCGNATDHSGRSSSNFRSTLESSWKQLPILSWLVLSNCLRKCASTHGPLLRSVSVFISNKSLLQPCENLKFTTIQSRTFVFDRILDSWR